MLKHIALRCYATGRPIIVDFSPVTDFHEATCRQYEENNCNRGGYCNFMHLKRIGRLVVGLSYFYQLACYIPLGLLILLPCLITDRELRRQLFGRYWGRRSLSRSRSRSPLRHCSQEECAYRGRGYSRRYDDYDYYYDGKRRRHRSTSPDHRRGQSRSPARRRDRSPVREGSEERRAKIEQWNREREEQERAKQVNSESVNTYDGYEHRDHCAYEGQQQYQRPQDGVCGY